MKSLLAGATVLLLSAVLVVMPLTPQSASANTGVLPPPVGILPSVIAGATKGATGLSAAYAPAVFLTTMVKSPEVYQAILAKRASTATAAQLALIAADKTAFAVPATKTAKLIRGVGPAAVIVAGFQAGMMAGDGAARFFGFTDSQVCAQNNGVLTAVSAVTNGVSCDAWKSALTDAQKNLDADATVNPVTMCVPGGSCYNVAVRRASPTLGQHFLCIIRSGSGSTANGFAFVLSNDVTGVGSTGYNFPYVCQDLGASFANTTGLGPFTNTNPLKSLSIQYGNNLRTTPQTVGFTPGNPSRQFKCTQYSLQGNLYVGTSPSWTDNDPAFQQPNCPALPAGQTPSRTTIEETGGPATRTLYDQPTTPEFQQWKTNYPNADNEWVTELFRGADNCHALLYACADWFTTPSKADTYNCKYGGQAVALSECNYLAPTFKPGAVENGTSYADPTTGISPTVPTTTPAGGSETSACWPSGWGVLNPFSWVLQPLNCWARAQFIPSAVGAANLTSRANVGAMGTPIAAIPGFLAQFTSMFTIASGGCAGPPWHFNAPALGLDETYYPFSACEEPMAGAASFTKGALSFAAIVVMFLAAVRYFVGTIGFMGLGGSESVSRGPRFE